MDRTFYMSLPVSEREKFRERQKLKTYREYTRNLTSLDANAQMEAETDYLEYENQVLFQRLTNGDSKMLDITDSVIKRLNMGQNKPAPEPIIKPKGNLDK